MHRCRSNDRAPVVPEAANLEKFAWRYNAQGRRGAVRATSTTARPVVETSRGGPISPELVHVSCAPNRRPAPRPPPGQPSEHKGRRYADDRPHVEAVRGSSQDCASHCYRETHQSNTYPGDHRYGPTPRRVPAAHHRIESQRRCLGDGLSPRVRRRGCPVSVYQNIPNALAEAANQLRSPVGELTTFLASKPSFINRSKSPAWEPESRPACSAWSSSLPLG